MEPDITLRSLCMYVSSSGANKLWPERLITLIEFPWRHVLIDGPIIHYRVAATQEPVFTGFLLDTTDTAGGGAATPTGGSKAPTHTHPHPHPHTHTHTHTAVYMKLFTHTGILKQEMK